MRRLWILVAICICTTGATAAWAATRGHTTSGHRSRVHHTRPVQHARKHPPHKQRRGRHATTHKTAKPATRLTATNKVKIAGVDPVLFGDQAVETTTDGDAAGVAQAFPFSNSNAGTTASIDVYLDSMNAAKTLVVGLYSNKSGHPGSLLAHGSLSSPAAGSWNQVSIGSATVSAGRTYWVTVLGTGGRLGFRAHANGSCSSQTSYQTTLTSLPSSWRTGASYSACPISAYVNGYLTSSQTISLPSNTAVPAVTGTAQQSQVLTTSNGTWSGSPTGYSYQWQDCDSSGNNCTNVSGATSSSYMLASGDVGHTMRAVVTATNSGGSAAATSDADRGRHGDPRRPRRSATRPRAR